MPYCTDSQILKSCDVKFPLRISLLAVRDLAQKIKDAYGKLEDLQQIEKITYVCPQEYENENVMKLLMEC